MTQDQVNYLRPSPLLANLSASGNSYKRYCISPANIQFQETSADKIHLSGRPLLIKLHADHPCIDFLLIDKPAGVSSEKLFLCLLYTSPSPRDATLSRMPSSA